MLRKKQYYPVVTVLESLHFRSFQSKLRRYASAQFRKCEVIKESS